MPNIVLKTEEKSIISLDDLDIATLKQELIKKTLFISPDDPLPSFYIRLSRSLYTSPDHLKTEVHYDPISAELLLNLLKY